jgi:hypothetical protein
MARYEDPSEETPLEAGYCVHSSSIRRQLVAQLVQRRGWVAWLSRMTGLFRLSSALLGGSVRSQQAPVDLPALSEALGGNGVGVDGGERLRSTIEAALRADRPTLIELGSPAVTP